MLTGRLATPTRRPDGAAPYAFDIFSRIVPTWTNVQRALVNKIGAELSCSELLRENRKRAVRSQQYILYYVCIPFWNFLFLLFYSYFYFCLFLFICIFLVCVLTFVLLLFCTFYLLVFLLFFIFYIVIVIFVFPTYYFCSCLYLFIFILYCYIISLKI